MGPVPCILTCSAPLHEVECGLSTWLWCAYVDLRGCTPIILESCKRSGQEKKCVHVINIMTSTGRV